jgi:hypothetical protein
MSYKAITPLTIPERVFGQPIPVAPDTNAEVAKINELVAAVNAGLGVSNAIVGGPKYVQYRLSGLFGVPNEAQTLDRLNPATVLPGNMATVINSSDTPMSGTAPQKQYVATVVPAGTAGAVAVPAYAGASSTVLIVWQEVVSADSFTFLLASELSTSKKAYAGLALRPLLIKLIEELNTGSTVITTPPDNSAPKAPTNGAVDDMADTFSFIANPTYPSFAQYKVAGLPGVTGAVVLDATNSYVQGSRIYIKVVGPVAIRGLAVYVAGSGNVPDGAPLLNLEAFTGVAAIGKGYQTTYTDPYPAAA